MNVIKLYNLYMENLRDHPTKHSSLSHDEKFCTLKAKVSLIEVQVNLTEKQVIYTNYNYPVGQNFVGQNFRRAKFSSLFKKFVTFARQNFAREGSSTRITLNHYFDILKCFVYLMRDESRKRGSLQCQLFSR